jgi:hypothetical protein
MLLYNSKPFKTTGRLDVKPKDNKGVEIPLDWVDELLSVRKEVLNLDDNGFSCLVEEKEAGKSIIPNHPILRINRM